MTARIFNLPPREISHPQAPRYLLRPVLERRALDGFANCRVDWDGRLPLAHGRRDNGR